MFFYLILILFIYLPFQIALNPTGGIDLASVRILIPAYFLAWLFVSLKNKKLIVFSNSTTALFLSFLFFATFSMFFAQNLIWSLRKLLFLLSIVPVYFFLPTILDNFEKIKKAISFLVYGGALLALIGIIQFLSQFIFGIDRIYRFWAKYIIALFLGNSFSQAVLTYPSWLVNISGKNYLRATSVFPDPHMLAYYLGMLLPWSIALYFYATEKKQFFLYTSSMIFVADLLTFSRGGYLGLLFAFILVLPLIYRKIGKKILLAPLLLLFIFLYPQNPITSRFSSSLDLQDGSNKGRIELWQQTIQIIKERPLGVGLGNYSLEIKPTADYRDPIYAHSLYLDIAAELGIFALLAWLAFSFSILQNFLKKSLQNKFYLAGFFSMIIYLTHSLVENPLFSVHIFTLLLIIAAISTIKTYAK